jgi:penicillin amidase
MKRAVRGILIALGCIAGVTIILAGAWLVLTRISFPRVRGTQKLEGLSATVTIQRDKYGVPHIYARTSKDLFFAEGYVHAQDRFWQMEFCRRIGAGRLSEIFGKSQLQTDIFLRTLGIARAAQQEYEQADPELKGLLGAYAAGVNAWILKRSPARLGLEFAVLNLTGVKTKIAPWTPVDTLSWAKMMGWSGEDSWGDEVMMMRVLHTRGIPGIRRLFSPYRSEMPFTVSDEELGFARIGFAGPFTLLGRDGGFGSNAWVIAGSRSSSGKPIFANDMHLDVQIPSIWYEVGLHGVDEDGRVGRTKECPYDLYGYSLPGAPGVVAGHNDRIAWGFTYLNGDTQDLYQEKINPQNPDQYLVDGEWKNMQFAYEEIPVRKAKEPYRLRVRTTRHGPIISDHGEQAALEGFESRTDAAFPEGVQLTAVSFRWAALQPSSVVRAELLLDRAENYQQFREALRNWSAPALNVAYADVDGNIGYQCVGRIPIRARSSGEAPMPGWSSTFEWKGSIPFDELPRSLNPPKGYIVTANNPPAGRAYPYLLGKELDYGYRARRIVEMIESHKTPIGVKDIQEMQADNLNYTAREVCGALKGLDLGPTALERRIADEKSKDLSTGQKQDFEKRQAEALGRMQAAREMLLEWDGRMSAGSAAAALYAYFWQQLVTEIFRDQFPETEWPMSASARAENAVHYLLQDPDAALWDDVTTPEREGRDEILIRSFRRGYTYLVDKLGKNPEKWRWDKIHTITFVNQTLGKSGIAPIEKIFNRGPYPLAGGPTEVDAEAWDRKNPFKVTHCPSMRMIVDMGNIAGALSVLPTGQSGHPGNKHYDDFIKLWSKVEYHPALWAPGDSVPPDRCLF